MSSTTRVVRPTQAQILATWRTNAAEWSDGMTVDQHVAREEAQIRTYATAKDAWSFPRQHHWILVPSPTPSSTRNTDQEDDHHDDEADILAACEGLYRPAFVHDSHAATFCIASVFVPRECRGRGYASALMSHVSHGSSDGDSGSTGSALFSDIGPTFYAKWGWKTYRSAEVIVTHFHHSSLRDARQRGQQGTYVTHETLQACCDEDVLCVKAQVARLQRQNTMQAVWSFLPTADVMRWHYARTHYVNCLHNHAPLQKLGYMLAGEHDGLILWNIQTDKRIMTILRMRYESQQGLVLLMNAAMATAVAWKCDKIVIWDGRLEDFSGVDATVRESERTTSIPALHVRDMESVDWINIEKFCWC